MFDNMSNDDVRTICKKSIENFEIWSRRIIDSILTEEIGIDYFNSKNERDEYILKKELREKSNKSILKNPERYNRIIDTILLDDIIYILTKTELYKNHFKKVLDILFPIGNDNIKIILSKLIDPRNNLAHANPISIRHAEQIICYTNDFIECYKQYFVIKGEEKMWNVPQIIKLIDSKGFEKNNFKNENSLEIVSTGHQLYVGELYQVEVIIDPTFNEDDYSIKWKYAGKNYENSERKFMITFTDADVSQMTFLQCDIISKKTWHKHRFYDHRVSINFSVHPK